MTTIERKVAVGVFTSFEQAEGAVENLRQAGFSEESIGFISRDARYAPQAAAHQDESFEMEGLIAGLTTGAGVGALWGLGVVAGVMPVVGPAIAAGSLAAILSSAAAGAALVGVTGMFIGLGISRVEADYYEEEVNLGRIVVSVEAGERHEEALEILYHSGAYNYETRTQTVVGM